MSNQPRIVIPGVPVHVVQRGNRRQTIFFCDDDYRLYQSLLAHQYRRFDVVCLAYVQMPNHTHQILLPKTTELSRPIQLAHQAYAAAINEREGWTGHLFQDRFKSFLMDDAHQFHGVRYVEYNPPRAGLVAAPQDWPWSSARAHLAGRDDDLVTVAPLLELYGDWATYLGLETPVDMQSVFRDHTRTGRPLGNPTFLATVQRQIPFSLPGPRGRPPKIVK